VTGEKEPNGYPKKKNKGDRKREMKKLEKESVSGEGKIHLFLRKEVLPCEMERGKSDD